MNIQVKSSIKYQFIIVAVMALFFSSCKDENKKENGEENVNTQETVDKVNSEELKYVINDGFPVGDVRRYGIVNEGGDPTHPYTKKPTTQSILELAQKENIKLFFPKGYYKFGLYFKGIQDITIESDGAEFGGPLYFIEDAEGNESKDIKITGNITTYYKVFMRKCQDIEFETVNVVSNPEKNIAKLNSMGCDIYGGSKFIYFKNLIIDGLGSDGDSFKLNRAALQVHGWNNNPESLTIDHLKIISSDRHGVYLTGNNHNIQKITIDKFGVGSYKGMNDLDDSAKGQTDNVTGLWLNKCNNTSIGNVTINTANSKGTYSVWLDEGNTAQPTTIESITLTGGDKKLPLFAEETTNVVVRDLKK
ncbi:hypothetical protein [Lacinutrix chionoecetis]